MDAETTWRSSRLAKEKRDKLAFISLRHPDYSPAILCVSRIKEIREIGKGRTEIAYDSETRPVVTVIEPKLKVMKKIKEARG